MASIRRVTKEIQRGLRWLIQRDAGHHFCSDVVRFFGSEHLTEYESTRCPRWSIGRDGLTLLIETHTEGHRVVTYLETRGAEASRREGGQRG